MVAILCHVASGPAYFLHNSPLLSVGHIRESLERPYIIEFIDRYDSWYETVPHYKLQFFNPDPRMIDGRDL